MIPPGFPFPDDLIPLPTATFDLRLLGAPVVVQSPVGAVSAPNSGPVLLIAEVVNADTFQWTLDGEPIEDGPLYAGTQTFALAILPTTESEGAYELVATNDFGSVTTTPAVLAVKATCPSDIDGSDIVDLNDLLAVLANFGSTCP